MYLLLHKTLILTRVFIIKLRHPGRPTKADLGGKTRSGSPWLHAEKRLLPQLEVNVRRFFGVLLLRNKHQK